MKAYLAKEEGVGRYQRIIGTDFSPGDVYMAKAGPFWSDVRKVWSELFKQHDELAIDKQVDGVHLFMPLFQYADEVSKAASYDSKAGTAKALTIIKKHLR